MQLLRSTSLRAAAGALALFTLGACKDDPSGPATPTAVVAVSPVASAGTAGDLIAEPLTVKVTDANGAAISGIPVTFTVAQGGGSVTPVLDSTDGSGVARTTWRLGGTAGQQQVVATVNGVATGVTFVATASAAAPATIAMNAGDNQSAAAGATVANAPSVIVRDRFNNPVPGVSVFFTVSGGNGSVTGAGATTNASGVASVGEWRLGSSAGVNRLTALAISSGVTGNPITFTANGTAGSASALVALSSTSPTGNVGALVTPSPSVRVTDANGNPVSNVQVTFTPSTGSTVVGGAKNTDVNGVATVDGWQLGSTAQTYTLTATANGTQPVTFTVTGRAGNASQVALFAGNAQTTQAGRAVDIEPAVRVTDSFGNPIPGVEVVFEVVSGGGSAIARRPVTNANGVATVGAWTLGDVPGANTLRATVQANGITGNPVLFNATGTPGAPASISINAGNGQSATINTALPVSPSVTVRDSRGNVVPGVQVTFIAGNGGTIVPNIVTTNAQGVATGGVWTLGATVGQQTLTVRVNGVADVVLTATGQSGQPASVAAVSTTLFGNVVVNTLAPTAPSVVVRDAQGNPVPNAQVTFIVTSGNGTLTGAVQTTDAQGIATVGSWRFGTAANVLQNVTVQVAGLAVTGNEPDFDATTVAGAAANVTVTAAPPATPAPSTGHTVTVRVTDQFGNAVANQLVSFTPNGGNGSANPTVVQTNATGDASTSWTLPAGTGARTLVVTVVGTTLQVNIVVTAT